MPNPDQAASTVVLPLDYYYCRNRSSFHFLRVEFSKKEHIVTTTIFTIYARKITYKKTISKEFFYITLTSHFFPVPWVTVIDRFHCIFLRGMYILSEFYCKYYRLLYQHDCIQWKPVIRTSLTDENVLIYRYKSLSLFLENGFYIHCITISYFFFIYERFD